MASNFWNGDFYFDGTMSTAYKVCIVDFNSREMVKQIGGSHTIALEKDMSYNDKPYYRESEKTSDDIILQLCRTDGKPWTSITIIEIANWLFKKNFKKFQPMDFTNQEYNLVYYLKAIDMKKMLSPSMEGYLEITFKQYDGYVYAIPQNSITLNGSGTKTINNISNVDDIYYPKIKISNCNNLKITNSTNGTSLSISNAGGETIMIDCAIGSVVNSSNTNRFSILNDYNFIGLEKGRNNIQIEGNSLVEFICEFPIIM